MNKRTLPEYHDLKAANDLLHETKNKYARTLLGRTSTCTDYAEAIDIRNCIEKSHLDASINDAEYEALIQILNTLLINGRLNVATPFIKEASAIEVFRKRIWSCPDISKVALFRNTVTDLWTLDMITLEEYIELNNEVDKYIQYTLSNGGMK